MIVIPGRFIALFPPRVGSRALTESFLCEDGALAPEGLTHPSVDQVRETKEKFGLPVYCVMREPKEHLRSWVNLIPRRDYMLDQMTRIFKLDAPCMNGYHKAGLVDKTFWYDKDLSKTKDQMMPDCKYEVRRHSHVPLPIELCDMENPGDFVAKLPERRNTYKLTPEQLSLLTDELAWDVAHYNELRGS